MSDDLRDLFDPGDVAELSAAMAQAATDADPVLAWRQALSRACTAESVTYVWDFEAETTHAFALGWHPITVPDRVIEELREQGARPEAVACHLKAVSIDPRFASWDEEDE